MSNHRSRIIAFGLVALALVSTSVMPVTAQGPFPVFAPNRSSVDTVANVDQVIIRYRPTGGRIVPADVGQLRALSLTAGETLTYKREMSGERTHVLKLGRRVTSTEAEAITAKLAGRPEIESAQPDYKRYPTLIPNDPLFAQQWDLGAPAAGIYGANLPAAWDLTTGAGSPVIAIIDTGYRPHADLVAHIIPGFDFISDAQVGNDGDGRDADPSDPGDWITAAESASGYFAGCPVSNSSWHGTHVAGTIGAVSNNNLGVTGINWNARIQPLRVLGKCGGYTSDIVDAIRWAAGIPVTGVPNNATPAKVINMSLGGSGACSAVEQAAVTDAVNAGTTVVVAAGNSNADASGFSPASCNGVISVAATGPTGNRAYYSNYGASVKIAAPGGDSSVGGTAGGVILSTLNDGLTTPGADSYAGYQGTSMATPHVVGVVSLMLAVNPSLKPAQVLQILQQSVTAFPAGSTCTTTTCGPGILNAAAAVAAAGALNPNPTATPTSTATSTPAPPTNTPPPQQPTSTSAPASMSSAVPRSPRGFVAAASAIRLGSRPGRPAYSAPSRLHTTMSRTP